MQGLGLGMPRNRSDIELMSYATKLGFTDPVIFDDELPAPLQQGWLLGATYLGSHRDVAKLSLKLLAKGRLRLRIVGL